MALVVLAGAGVFAIVMFLGLRSGSSSDPAATQSDTDRSVEFDDSSESIAPADEEIPDENEQPPVDEVPDGDDGSMSDGGTPPIPTDLAETLVAMSADAQVFINDNGALGFDRVLAISYLWQLRNADEPLAPEVAESYIGTLLEFEGEWLWRVTGLASMIGRVGNEPISSDRDLVTHFETYLIERFTAGRNASNAQLGALVASEEAWRGVMSDIYERDDRLRTQDQISAAVRDAAVTQALAEAALSDAADVLGLG